MCSRNESQPGLFYLSDAELAQFCKPHSFYVPEKSVLKKVILSRSELRAFLGARAFYQPDFFCADTFEKISAWAVKQNQFPMLLKSDANGRNSENIFLLKAFRELPEFFEKIREDIEGKLLIENFVPAKARIEVTFLNDAIVLVSQVSLDKSLKCRHAWRAFPLNLPKAYLQEVKSFIQKNPDLINLKNVPVRITFAINSGRLIPLSVNPGFNRLEYFPAWGDIFREAETADSTRYLNKLLFFYLSDRQVKRLNVTELETILADSLCRFWPGTLSVVWLKTSSNQIMKDDSKKAAVFFNAINSEDFE